MTVAAIVMIPDWQTAVADAHGEPAIRRVLQAAWAGGALPLVAVLPPELDAEALTGPLADLPATLVRPAREVPHGIARFVAGLDAATEAVTETAACLLWPVRHAWVDPETVTSLVEAHGAAPEAIIRPAFGGQPGFPVLVPVPARAMLLDQGAAPAGTAIEAAVRAGFPALAVELGDPGIVHDLATPWSALPQFDGPQQPAGGRRGDETGDPPAAD